MTTAMEIKRTDDGWEMSCAAANRDYHLRFERDEAESKEVGVWVLDEFDTSIKDIEAAFIETTDHNTAEEAMHEAFNRCEEILNAGTANDPKLSHADERDVDGTGGVR